MTAEERRTFTRLLGKLGLAEELEATALREHGATLYQAFSGGRRPHLVRVRHLVYRTLHSRFGWTHAAIADAAHVDTSTIWHALSKGPPCASTT